MKQNIQVSCSVNRYWIPSTMEQEQVVLTEDWEEILVNGTLIDISTQTAEDGSGKLIPVGIVLLDDDDTFQCVPMEFIKKIEN